jgi:hypothetical protein
MPAADTQQQTSSPAPTVLLWAGIGVAPVAGGLLVIGGGSGLVRVGGLLAMVAIVLLGSSVVMARRQSAIETYVVDEVEQLREDLRSDISHAAKMTHRAMADRLIALSDTVEALRGQMEVLRAHVERTQLAVPQQPPAAAPPQAASKPVVRHTETVQVTTRKTEVVDDHDGVYGRGNASVPAQRRPEGADQYSSRAERRASERWAALRAEDHSSELRMGERSAELRTDDTGTELRMQDRWASVVHRGEDTGGRRRRDEDRASHTGEIPRHHTGEIPRQSSQTGDIRASRYETTGGRYEQTGGRYEQTGGREYGTPRATGSSGRAALPSTPSGEPVPDWSAAQPQRARVSGGTEYGGAARPGGTQYGGTQYGSPRSGSEYRGTEYGGARGGEPGRGTQYGSARRQPEEYDPVAYERPNYEETTGRRGRRGDDENWR